MFSLDFVPTYIPPLLFRLYLRISDEYFYLLSGRRYFLDSGKYFSCCECLSLSLFKLSLLHVYPLEVLDPLFFVLFSSLLLVNFTLHGANLFVLFSLLSRLKFYKLTWLVKKIFGASRIIGEKHRNSSTTLQQDVVVHREQTVVSLQRNSGICSALL